MTHDPLPARLRQHLFENGAALVQLRISEIQCRQQPKDILVRAVDKQPPLHARLYDRGAIADHFNANHATFDTHSPNGWALGTKCFETSSELLADLLSPCKEVLRLDGFNGSQGGDTGERIAAEGGRVRPRPQFLRKRGPG